MPAKSEKQRRFFGAELQRKRAGKKTRTHMTEKEMEKFASTKSKHLPMKVTKKKTAKAKSKSKKK